MDEIDAAATATETATTTTTATSQQGSAQPEATTDEADCASRSERKRIREKQRRLDVRNAFEELSSVMAILDPGGMSSIIRSANNNNDDNDHENDTININTNTNTNNNADRKKRKRPADQDSANRVEIIQQATQIMRRLHRENEQAKHLIAQLQASRDPVPPKNDNVLVMVPTLSLAEEHHPVAHAQYPPYFQHTSNINNNQTSHNSTINNTANDSFRLLTNQPQNIPLPHHLHQSMHVFPQSGNANTIHNGSNRNNTWNRFSQQQQQHHQPTMQDNLQHLVHDNMSSSNSATSKDSHNLNHQSQAGHPNNSTYF